MKPEFVQLGRGGARRPAQAPQLKTVQGRPPGSRRTEGSLESQADVAADGAVRHLPNVSRGLTEAPPARYDAPASVGRELATEVRADLESTFGADLAAVRVHDDATAHSSARGEEAQAFTAGRDVYFAQGKHAPASAEGYRLLAHEIAHVLQQTGRRLSSTLVQATEREGAGDIQRAGEQRNG